MLERVFRVKIPNRNRVCCSKKKLFFLYGKWTDFIKCVDIAAYDEYMKEFGHKFKRDERSRSPNESPAHTPRKLLSKMNSLKMSSFRSLSIQEVEATIIKKTPTQA